MIAPTVGHIVHYHPYESDPWRSEEVLAAIVAKVHSDTCVNLAVIEPNGNLRPRTSVLLVQEGVDRPDAGYCELLVAPCAPCESDGPPEPDKPVPEIATKREGFETEP